MNYNYGALPAGTRVTLVSIDSNNWARILYRGSIYYTQASNLAYAY